MPQSAWDRRMDQMHEDFRRMDEEGEWKMFQSAIYDCSKAIAFGGDTGPIDRCDKYKYRSEVTSKAQEIKDNFTRLNPSPSHAELIKGGRIKPGMTKDEVLLSWGPPGSKNRTVTAETTHEQWIYNRTYVYFDNDVMTAFQD